jgi:hypothetical protein
MNDEIKKMLKVTEATKNLTNTIKRLDDLEILYIETALLMDFLQENVSRYKQLKADFDPILESMKLSRQR